MDHHTLGRSGRVVSTPALDQLGTPGVHLDQDEIALLDAAGDPEPADYPYGGPGIDQRSRRLATES